MPRKKKTFDQRKRAYTLNGKRAGRKPKERGAVGLRTPAQIEADRLRWWERNRPPGY